MSQVLMSHLRSVYTGLQLTSPWGLEGDVNLELKLNVLVTFQYVPLVSYVSCHSC